MTSEGIPNLKKNGRTYAECNLEADYSGAKERNKTRTAG